MVNIRGDLRTRIHKKDTQGKNDSLHRNSNEQKGRVTTRGITIPETRGYRSYRLFRPLIIYKLPYLF